jgi:capsular polysaccharide biosynthesis protein
LSAYLIGFGRNGTIGLIYEDPIDLDVPEAVLVGGCTNYGHWIADYLPRLRFCNSDKDVPILVNRLNSVQAQSLSFLGIDSKRLIQCEYPQSYKIKRLLYPSTYSSFVTPPLEFQPWIVDWLRSSFQPLFLPEAPRRKLFISRSMQWNRRLINEVDILNVADRHGFEVIHPEKMPFEHQVRLFSQAAVIAGPHGSGLTNMIFAPPGTKIVELIGPSYHRVGTAASEWLRLAKLLHQEITRIVGQSDGLPIESNYPAYENYTIDPIIFEHALVQ